jgi:hypothetical protein
MVKVLYYSRDKQQQTDKKMKATKNQINKINNRIQNKYPDVNISVAFYGKLVCQYTEFNQSENDKYVFDFITSLINTESNADDIYYSI